MARAVVTMEELVADYFVRAPAGRAVPRRKIKLSEVERREATWRLHLAATFGHRPVAEVTRQDVEDWIADQVEEVGAAAASIRHRHWLLSTLFKPAPA